MWLSFSLKEAYLLPYHPKNQGCLRSQADCNFHTVPIKWLFTSCNYGNAFSKWCSSCRWELYILRKNVVQNPDSVCYMRRDLEWKSWFKQAEPLHLASCCVCVCVCLSVMKQNAGWQQLWWLNVHSLETCTLNKAQQLAQLFCGSFILEASSMFICSSGGLELGDYSGSACYSGNTWGPLVSPTLLANLQFTK